MFRFYVQRLHVVGECKYRSIKTNAKNNNNEFTIDHMRTMQKYFDGNEVKQNCRKEIKINS